MLSTRKMLQQCVYYGQVMHWHTNVELHNIYSIHVQSSHSNWWSTEDVHKNEQSVPSRRCQLLSPWENGRLGLMQLRGGSEDGNIHFSSCPDLATLSEGICVRPLTPPPPPPSPPPSTQILHHRISMEFPTHLNPIITLQMNVITVTILIFVSLWWQQLYEVNIFRNAFVVLLGLSKYIAAPPKPQLQEMFSLYKGQVTGTWQLHGSAAMFLGVSLQSSIE